MFFVKIKVYLSLFRCYTVNQKNRENDQGAIGGKVMTKKRWTFWLTIAVFVCALFTAVACDGDGGKLTIGGIPENGTVEMTETDMTLSLNCNVNGAEWSSSDSAVAVIDANGTVTLKGAGATVISARKGELSDEFILTVVDKRIPEVSCEIGGIPQDNTVSVEDGELVLTASCSDGSPVIWASRNEAVATVNDSGTVTLLRRGTVDIVARSANDSSVFAVCTLRVLGVPSQGITAVNGLPASGMIAVGSDYALFVKETPQDCEPSLIEWSVEDESIATVDADGVLHGISAGTTNLIASAQDGAISKTVSIEVVEVRQNYEDFTTAQQIGNYIAGVIEVRDSENALSPELRQEGDNTYLVYSHRMADGDGKYMIFSFSDLKPGVRYILEYRMKLLSVSDGTFDHQINVYGGQTKPVAMGDPLTGTLYAWSATNLDTSDKKIYQTGGTALYCDGEAYVNGTTNTDAFHTYTLAFTAGESVVGFGFVGACSYEVMLDYICVSEAPSADDFSIDCPTDTLPLNESMALSVIAAGDLLYYQPFDITYTSSDEGIANVSSDGVLTPVSEGKVTITARDNTLDKEHTITIEITSPIDRDGYDLFFDSADDRVDNSYLCLLYQLETPVVGALHNGYWVEIEIDTVYYRGPIEFYLAVLNTDADAYENVSESDLMAFKDWGQISAPASGKSSTQKYLIYLDWERSDYTIDHLGVYVRNASEFKIGVNVNLEAYDAATDPERENHDVFLSGNGWNNNAATVALAQPVFATQSFSVTISLDLSFYTGAITQIYLELYSGDVLYLNPDALDQRREDGWLSVNGAGKYTFTGEFLWSLSGNIDKIKIQVFGEGAYRVGIDNVSVEIEAPDMSAYDAGIIGNGWNNNSATITLSDSMYAAQNYTVSISFDLAFVSGTITQIHLALYSGETLFLNPDGLDQVRADGWLAVDGAKKYTFTGKFPWNQAGNLDKAIIQVFGEGAYIVGIDNFEIDIKAPDTSSYDKVIQATGDGSAEYVLTDLQYAAQNYTVKVSLNLTAVSGNVARMRILLYSGENLFLNQDLLDGVEKEGEWIVVNQLGTMTFTGTFDWAQAGNIDRAVVMVTDPNAYIVGINDFMIEIKAPEVPDIDDEYDLVISESEWSSTDVRYPIADAPYAAQNYTVTISLNLTVVTGSLNKMYLALYSGDAQFLNPNDLDKVTLNDGWIVLTQSGEYTFTGDFQWAQQGNVDKICIAFNGADFTVGISDLSVTTQAPEPPSPSAEGILVSGTSWANSEMIALEPAVSAAANAVIRITMDVQILSGGLDEIYIEIYNAADEMVATCGWDQSVAAGSGTYTFTSSPVAGTASSFEIAKIKVTLHREGLPIEVNLVLISAELQEA